MKNFSARHSTDTNFLNVKKTADSGNSNHKYLFIYFFFLAKRDNLTVFELLKIVYYKLVTYTSGPTAFGRETRVCERKVYDEQIRGFAFSLYCRHIHFASDAFAGDFRLEKDKTEWRRRRRRKKNREIRREMEKRKIKRKQKCFYFYYIYILCVSCMCHGEVIKCFMMANFYYF